MKAGDTVALGWGKALFRVNYLYTGEHTNTEYARVTPLDGAGMDISLKVDRLCVVFTQADIDAAYERGRVDERLVHFG